jgi:hypothetical protein
MGLQGVQVMVVVVFFLLCLQTNYYMEFTILLLRI